MKTVIHEIRNHLAVAIANIEAFRDGVLVPTPERLSAVLQALQEASVLIGEVPVVGVVVRNEPALEMMNVCEVIGNEVIGLEGSAAKRGIAFSIRRCGATADACRAFHGSPLRVAEIVNNVVSNAIRYTPAGGRIDVDCRHDAGSLVLTVADGGPGVSAEDRPRIFDAGYRGTASAGVSGSGLGLDVARRLVEALGGTIDLVESEDPGARFVVKMPGTR